MFHLLFMMLEGEAATPAAAGSITDTFNATQVSFSPRVQIGSLREACCEITWRDLPHISFRRPARPQAAHPGARV